MLYREFADPSLIDTTFKYIDLIALALYYLKHVINPFILFTMSADFRSGIATVCASCSKGEESTTETETQKCNIKRAEDPQEELEQKEVEIWEQRV